MTTDSNHPSSLQENAFFKGLFTCTSSSSTILLFHVYIIFSHVAFYENINQSRQVHLCVVKIWLNSFILITKQYITFLNVYHAGQKPAIKSTFDQTIAVQPSLMNMHST